MPVAAVVGHIDDLRVGIREQLPRALEAQLDLARAQRHAEFLAEQPAEMAFAAMQLRGEVGQRRIGQFGFRHLADHFPETLGKFVAGDIRQRRGQQTMQRTGPELQQGATQ